MALLVDLYVGFGGVERVGYQCQALIDEGCGLFVLTVFLGDTAVVILGDDGVEDVASVFFVCGDDAEGDDVGFLEAMEDLTSVARFSAATSYPVTYIVVLTSSPAG